MHRATEVAPSASKSPTIRIFWSCSTASARRWAALSMSGRSTGDSRLTRLRSIWAAWVIPRAEKIRSSKGSSRPRALGTTRCSIRKGYLDAHAKPRGPPAGARCLTPPNPVLGVWPEPRSWFPLQPRWSSTRYQRVVGHRWPHAEWLHRY